MLTKSIISFLFLSSLTLHAFSLKIPSNTPKSFLKAPKLDLTKFDIDTMQKSVNMKALPALLAGLFLIGNPLESHALSSGSRSGGSSFRSSSSMRSYSAPSSRSSSPSVRSYGPTIMPIVPMPYFNPFFPSYGFGYGFGFGGLTNLLLLGGTIYVASRVLGAFSGTSFGGFGSSAADSATVIKLNIALNSDWGNNGIIPAITEIATSSGDLSERGELSKLLSETSLALLRRSNDFIAISHESKSFNSDSENTESYFQRMAIKERSKFERENSPARMMIDNGSKSSLAVVSLVVALRGSQNPAYKSARSLTDAREILQSLAADAMTDGGNNVLAVELLWSPESPNTVITDRDLIMDYPELMRL
jgi:uncharacterized membrane protein